MNPPTIIKLAVSLLILILVILSVDLNQVYGLIIRANIPLLILAAALVFVGAFISSYKLGLLLNIQNIKPPLKKIFVAYLIGMFFNSFFPSTIGGDVIKARILQAKKHPFSKVFPAIIVERYLGLLSLAPILCFGLIWAFGKNYGNTYFLSLFVIVALLISFFILLGLKNKSWSAKIINCFPNCAKKHAENYFGALIKYAHMQKLVFPFGISIIFQFICVIFTYLVALSLGVDLNIFYLFLAIPIIALISMIPISINGIGVRESAYAIFLSQIGISTTTAVVISVVGFAITTLVSLTGGVLYFAITLGVNRDR